MAVAHSSWAAVQLAALSSLSLCPESPLWFSQLEGEPQRMRDEEVSLAQLIPSWRHGWSLSVTNCKS